MEDFNHGRIATPTVPSEKNAALIAEVKKFPALYDVRDPDYYILARRNEAWLEVARNCGEPADQCHLRWKSLRKRFAKEKRRFPEILQGQRRPWVLFPKMAFLTPISYNTTRNDILRARLQGKRVSRQERIAEEPSEDDMLILNENDEIVRTCKPGELDEEDEYIYETLDDPESLTEMMKSKPLPAVKPKAIRSGGPLRPAMPPPSRIGGSGRIRKVTPKMQNSIIAKKLKQAQTFLNSSVAPPPSFQPTKTAKRVFILNKTPVNKPAAPEAPTKQVQTVSPPSIKVEKQEENKAPEESTNNNKPLGLTEFVRVATPSSEEKKTFKVFKLKGRNPMIFSPDQLPEIQELLKSESAATPIKDAQAPAQTPTLKIRSVDNLNKEGSSQSGPSDNLDIIHSVGLVRKGTVEKVAKPTRFSHQSYTRAYSWNRPPAKLARKARQVAERLQQQPDSQTNDYEIEESWNDIKQERMDEDCWAPSQEGSDSYLPHEPMVVLNTSETTGNRNNNLLTKVNEAKLDLINYQRKLLDEQHRKTLEYMKKEHDMKMIVLRAEIDLKRKQLNILL